MFVQRIKASENRGICKVTVSVYKQRLLKALNIYNQKNSNELSSCFHPKKKKKFKKSAMREDLQLDFICILKRELRLL